MAEITLQDIFGPGPGRSAYTASKDFSFVSLPEAVRIGKLVATAMKARGPGDGEAVIRTIAFAMKPEARGVFLGWVGDAFGGTRVYKVNHDVRQGL